MLPGLHIFDSKVPGPTTLITTFLHGDEIVGDIVIQEITKLCTTQPYQGTILLLKANLAAKAIGRRFVDNDLNRAFAATGDSSEDTRAQEIQSFFASYEKKIDTIIDFHSTPSESEPMIICSNTKQSIALAKNFPLQEVVVGLIEKIEGTSIGAYFSQQGTVDIAFECGSHNSPETLAQAQKLVHTVRNLHNGKTGNIIPQEIIQVTDLIYTESKNFQFTKSYAGFETLAPGEVRARQGQTEFSFPTEKIILIPNSNLQKDLEHSRKTRVAYFGERQKSI